MRKFIFTLLLAVIGSTWIISMASERWCLPSYQTETEPWIVVSGVLAEDGYPCEPEEECPACQTIVLQADEGQTYYLTAGSTQADEQLDTAHLYANVTIEGVPFTRGSYNYIKVSNITYKSCNQYNLIVSLYVDSTMTYTFSGYQDKEPPHVDSIWITGGLSDSATIYLVSHAQPNEKIDLSFLRRGRYICYAQVEDYITSALIVYRYKSPVDFPKGTTWTTLFTPYENCHDAWSYTCELQGDTLIENSRYYTIVHGPIDVPIRQVGQKIYAWINNQDCLLYDFGLEIGDSIPWRIFEINYDASQVGVYGQDFAHVERIDTVLLADGRKAKRWLYDDRMPDIEYVGGEVGILSPIILPEVTTCGGTHMCCSLDGELIYETSQGICDFAGDLHPLRLPSLCDTWNILEIYGRGVLPADEQDYTTKIDRLATDTVINNHRYVQLLEETSYADKTNIRYQGALREGDNAKIYFIPPASTHEYLLYAFNAQVGDKLSNLWIGGPEEDNGGVNATIVSVTDEYPRVFTLDVEIVEPYPDGENIVTYPYKWVEGVGLDGGPRGLLCESVFGCACSCTQFVLCAYKDGKQVYAEKASEDWGCDFNHHPQPVHRLDDLCDEWTMVVYPVSVLPESDDSPIYYTQRLTADTLINGKAYRKLCGGAFWKGVDKNNYLGAMRQEYYYIKSQDPHKPGYRDGIFYIPEGSTHAYLLYDFNCYVGDTLRNLWIGGMNPDNAPDGYTGVVTAISASNPRRFELDIIDSNESVCNHLSWIEGVGTDGDGPTGESSCIAYDPSPALFCACKDGQKVYATTTNCQCGSLRLNYLCDTWNILGVATDGEGIHYRTFTQRLTTDTIINSKRYVKLEEGITYKGALREDDYGRVYIIPANSTHEYLSYASQVKVSDEFDNVWFGGNPSDFPNGSKVTVREIEQINGRKVFKLDVLYQLPVMEQARLWPYYSWIEGVGLPEGPSGDWCPFDCEGDYGQSILCAYKDGEQVYASETAEKFGCYYDSSEQHTDTVPLYVKDGPGSSTVDPVDPNEIVATLNGDELIIREYIGAEISFKLSKVSASNQAPARNQLMQSDSFRESVTITLTESGTYELELTNPEWNYSIVGTFKYMPTGVEDTPATVAPVQKVLINGRLLIKYGDKVYTLTGMQVE